MEAVDIRAGVAAGHPGYRQLGRYLLGDEVAAGGMATVHMGCVVGAGGFTRTVAIKRLYPQFARDPEFVAMFLDEARLAARVLHPNVISVQDVVVDGPDLFLVMDYVRGAPLSLLNRRARDRAARVPATIAARVLCDVLSGLHAAHEATDAEGTRLDIVHRDVSPQNILVGSDGVARVFDFGVAKAAGRLQVTRAGQLKGKLSYMPPEQVCDERLTRLADIYAASVVYWETLTGQRLFYSTDDRSTFTKVLTSPVPAPSSLVRGLPPALDRVVLRGVERDPARRYPTARDMAEAIAKYSRVASHAEVGEWVASLASEELAQSARRAAAIERLPPAEGALEFAERLALTARDSATHTRVHDGSQFSLDARSSVTPPPPATTASLVAVKAVAPRSRRFGVAVALAALAGVARRLIGRCLGAYRRTSAMPVLSCTAASAPAAVPPAFERACTSGVDNDV
jgi:serine/threonine protein kinase